MREPVTQQPASRRRAAGVEQRQERWRGFATQRFGDFEIAPRRGIEEQMLARAFYRQRADVRERRLLRRHRIAEQRARGTHRKLAVVDTERREVQRAEVLRQYA